MRKSKKLELLWELNDTLEEIPETVPIFDFLTYCRKVPKKKLESRTYEDLLKHLGSIFMNLSSNADRIDIVFHIWKEASNKKKEIGVVGNIQLRKQSLTPSDRIFQQSLTSFGAPTTSYVKVCGGHTSSQGLLKCFHKEADDCIPIRVNHAVQFIVAFSDTDIFVTLIYHFTR